MKRKVGRGALARRGGEAAGDKKKVGREKGKDGERGGGEAVRSLK